MDIRELRIGNYVKESGKICHVVSILSKSSANTFERVIVEDCNGIHSGGLMEIIQPIPLTEDILLKCGFEIISDGDGYYLELSIPDSSVVLIYSSLMLRVEVECMDIVDAPKHLHQLQNLIFVLSGKELEVEL